MKKALITGIEKKRHVSFFDPYNAKELSIIIKSLHLKHPQNIQNNYIQNINTFGKAFLELVNKATI